MASVASQLVEEVTAHAKSDSLEDARKIRADGTYFWNNLRTFVSIVVLIHFQYFHQKNDSRISNYAVLVYWPQHEPDWIEFHL